MSFMDKLKFWKKEEPFDYSTLEKGTRNAAFDQEFSGAGDPTAGLGGTDSLGPMQMPGGETRGEQITITGRGFEGLKPTQIEDRREGYARPQPTAAQFQPDIMSKDIEIVSAKLDSIRAGLESLGARLSNIEQELQRQNRKGGW